MPGAFEGSCLISLNFCLVYDLYPSLLALGNVDGFSISVCCWIVSQLVLECNQDVKHLITPCSSVKFLSFHVFRIHRFDIGLRGTVVGQSCGSTVLVAGDNSLFLCFQFVCLSQYLAIECGDMCCAVSTASLSGPKPCRRTMYFIRFQAPTCFTRCCSGNSPIM